MIKFDRIELLFERCCLVLDLAALLQDADVLLDRANLLFLLLDLALVLLGLCQAFLHFSLRFLNQLSRSLVLFLTVSLDLLKISDLLVFGGQLDLFQTDVLLYSINFLGEFRVLGNLGLCLEDGVVLCLGFSALSFQSLDPSPSKLDVALQLGLVAIRVLHAHLQLSVFERCVKPLLVINFLC